MRGGCSERRRSELTYPYAKQERFNRVLPSSRQACPMEVAHSRHQQLGPYLLLRIHTQRSLERDPSRCCSRSCRCSVTMVHRTHQRLCLTLAQLRRQHLEHRVCRCWQSQQRTICWHSLRSKRNQSSRWRIRHRLDR